MPEQNSYSWQGDILHETEPQSYAASLRYSRSRRALVVTIGHTDLPAFVSQGQLYIQAPLPSLFEAFAESLPEFVRDMEVRVSTEGGGSLSLDRNGRPILGETMAESRVVRGGSEWR